MEKPVFVNEDVVYLRQDYSRLLMFGRPPIASHSGQTMLMRPTRPPWTLYENSFVSVYPVIEAYQQKSVPGGTPSSPAQPTFLLYRASLRLQEAEEQYHRFNHQQLFNYLGPYVAQLVGHSFDVPDFCDRPWLEEIHTPPDVDAALFPFRQIYVNQPRSQQQNLYFGQPKPWKIEAESDTRRIFDHAQLHQFRWRAVFTPPPAGFRVIAVTAGWYNGVFRTPGDVFDLLTSNDFSDSTVNYQAGGGETVYGWMTQVSGATPLFNWLESNNAPYVPPQDPKRKLIM